VVPEAANCVQCGMCSYNCPMGIDVRGHAWRGLPVRDSYCLTCSECVPFEGGVKAALHSWNE